MDLIALALAKKYTDKVVEDSSGNITEQIKDQLLPEVNTDDNNKIVIVENGQWKLVSANRFKSNPITVSMRAEPNQAEFGRKIYSVTLDWSTNLPPVYIKVAGEELTDMGVTKKILEFEQGISSTKSWSISVKDELNNTANGSATLTFYNRNWYGPAPIPEDLNADNISDFIKNNLTKTSLKNSKDSSINPTSKEGEYIWYALPTRLGTCTFQAGALPGGFLLVGTFLFENELGYKENYYVYRSEKVLLGTHKVVIT